MLQSSLWSHDSPKPWESIHSISQLEKADEEEQMVVAHVDKNMDEDTPTGASIMITEPHVWSRLKIIYSFEYNGK